MSMMPVSLLNTLLLCVIGALMAARAVEQDTANPYYQRLPDCHKGYQTLQKKTSTKAILCPMFRDEEGFLSEWVAYYQMHGFDHIMMFDDKSSDNGLVELKPWVDSGFVSVRTNWTAESLNLSWHFSKNHFKKSMSMKALLETQCKREAIKWGYEIFVSLDIDEYLLPMNPKMTIVDSLDAWFTVSGGSQYCISKLNFAVSPHTAEPVNLLTIEAYHLRMTQPGKINYYMTVSPKCAYRLIGPHHNANTSEFMAYCCHFHGCQKYDFEADSRFCTVNWPEQFKVIATKNRGGHEHQFKVNHYSRSVEKYALKAKTWETSSGEVRSGQSQEDVAKGYDIAKFLSRNLGWHRDATILRNTCQLREQLAKMTGEVPYFRPGCQWYRNAEFGRHVCDPDKRGRYGRPLPEGWTFSEKNPFAYHGGSDTFLQEYVGKNGSRSADEAGVAGVIESISQGASSIMQNILSAMSPGVNNTQIYSTPEGLNAAAMLDEIAEGKGLGSAEGKGKHLRKPKPAAKPGPHPKASPKAKPKPLSAPA